MKEFLDIIAEPSMITFDTAVLLASIMLVLSCGAFIWIVYRQIKATETTILNDDDDSCFEDSMDSLITKDAGK